jgi:plastocyanin
MRKQMIGTICRGSLAMIGLLLWDLPVRAADTTIDIISPGPKFSEPDAIITKGDSITWVAKTDPEVPHRLINDSTTDPNKKNLTDQFANPETRTVKFDTGGVVVKYHCFFHPGTMRGTITVK